MTGNAGSLNGPAGSPVKIRFAIVGCGYVADNYMFAIGQYPHVEVVRAFDILPAHAARFTAHWGIPTVETREAFFAGLDCDMVLNLTNPDSHYDVSRACLEAGLSCCRFRGHEDKIVTKELESGYDETEVQP